MFSLSLLLSFLNLFSALVANKGVIFAAVVISLAVNCDKRRSAVEPAIHIVLRPSNGRLHRVLVLRVVLHGNSRYEQIPNIFHRLKYAILLQRIVVQVI